MNQVLHISMLLLLFAAYQSQNNEMDSPKLVGGPCEGCEAIFEYGDQRLSSVDTLPKFQATQPKLKITGTVYEMDGQTPAADVILYIYHTNRTGIYETSGKEQGWARQHSFIRGWIKTGKDGQYAFYTFRPAPYPDGREPEHVHLIVKEPNKKEYYVDNYLFDDDPMLIKSERADLANRGGSGIVTPQLEDGILTVKRDIILGLNIPNY